MSSPFVGEIRAWACNFAPNGWIMCQGQLLPIQQFTSLFALIGTYYGGNGTSNFQLPDLRGRAPVKWGVDQTGTTWALGEIGGAENVTLTSSTMPQHTHTVFGTSASGTNIDPLDNTVMATNAFGNNFYASPTSLTNINPGTVSLYQGGNLPHPNLQPYLAINWCISWKGIFPSRN